MAENAEQNLAQTLAEHMKKPQQIPLSSEDNLKHIVSYALPPGWKKEDFDLEKHLPAPLRKKGTVALDDADSFIAFAKNQGSLGTSAIYCTTDYDKQSTSFSVVLNEHGETTSETGWRDHRATFSPILSTEWKRWNAMAGEQKGLSQVEFAEFIERNRQDVASGDGLPSGADMLEMALNFEANQDMKFKSAMRLQSGAVEMAYVQSDAEQTVAKMKMFERFNIGIPVFLGDSAYKIEARMRYRVPGGSLRFYVDLIRTDVILKDATDGMRKRIQLETGMPLYMGKP